MMITFYFSLLLANGNKLKKFSNHVYFSKILDSLLVNNEVVEYFLMLSPIYGVPRVNDFNKDDDMLDILHQRYDGCIPR